jgi:hypothetical protein
LARLLKLVTNYFEMQLELFSFQEINLKASGFFFLY